MSKIILTGRGCCGKTYLKEKFISRGFNPSISYTSRDIREGEENGKDYHFITKIEFEHGIKNGAFLEWEEFNGYYYGTPFDTNGTVFIMSTDGIKQIPEEDRNKYFIIYIDINNLILHQRMLDRGWNDDKIINRMLVDDIKYRTFDDYDLRITDPEF